MIVKQVLDEEFLDYIKVYGEALPVYVNPNSRDIRDLMKTDIKKKYVRFIADNKNKKFYVFPDELLHFFASNHLGITYSTKSKDYIFGFAKVNNNKLEVNEKAFSNYHKSIDEILLNIKEWEWTKNYSDLYEKLNMLEKKNES